MVRSLYLIIVVLLRCVALYQLGMALVVGFLLMFSKGRFSVDSGPVLWLSILGGAVLWVLAKPIAAVVTSGLEE